MNVNHELAHHYIAALSCTKEGAELVQALELENSRNILHSLNLIYRRGASTNPDQIIKHVEPRIRLTPTAIDYRVFASRTFLATVRLRPGYDPSRNKPPQVFIVSGAFNHDYTTSVRLRKLINALYVAASPNSNQKAIQTLRDENVTYWGDDIIVL